MMRLILYSALLIPAALSAQALEPDSEGCKDSKLVTRMPACRIHECSVKDFDSAELVTGLKNEERQLKHLEGKVETIQYECPANVSPLQIVRNLEAALRKVGYMPRGTESSLATTVIPSNSGLMPSPRIALMWA